MDRTNRDGKRAIPALTLICALTLVPAAAGKVNKLEGKVDGDPNSKVKMNVKVGKLETESDAGPVEGKAPLAVKKFKYKEVDADCADGETIELKGGIPRSEFSVTNSSFGVLNPRLFSAPPQGEELPDVPPFRVAGAILKKGKKVEDAALELNVERDDGTPCATDGVFDAKKKKKR